MGAAIAHPRPRDGGSAMLTVGWIVIRSQGWSAWEATRHTTFKPASREI